VSKPLRAFALLSVEVIHFREDFADSPERGCPSRSSSDSPTTPENLDARPAIRSCGWDSPYRFGCGFAALRCNTLVPSRSI
jgi:hypothetical protein